MKTIPAISLWQPWASALFAPANPGASPRAIKEYETRHWPMPARLAGQTVAIHAAKRETPDEREFWADVVMAEERREIYGHAFKAIGVEKYADLPRGALIGTVVFAASKRVEELDSIGEIETDWGNFSSGRWAWPVMSSLHFPQPVPCRGCQGFFNVEMPLEAFCGIIA